MTPRVKSELELLRSISVKRQGTKIVLSGLTPEPLPLHMLEAHELFSGLMKAIPGIPNAVSLAWDWRNTPTVKVRMFYGLDKDLNIVHTSAIGEAYLHNTVLLRTKPFPTKEEAYAYLALEFGEVLELTEVYDSPGSYASAGKLRVMELARQYAASQGISLEELWRRVNAAQKTEEKVG